MTEKIAYMMFKDCYTDHKVLFLNWGPLAGTGACSANCYIFEDQDSWLVFYISQHGLLEFGKVHVPSLRMCKFHILGACTKGVKTSECVDVRPLN